MKTINHWFSRFRIHTYIRGSVLIVMGVTLLYLIAAAQNKPASDAWSAWRFLIGEWNSQPDSTGVVGGTTFSLELQDRVLVRKNYAKYPASGEKPAVNHEDLMIISEQPGNPAEARYWDSEGHAIHYFATFSDNQDTLNFVSDVIPNAPRFRLSYVKLGLDSLKVDFAFAPPANPDAFQLYVSGVLHRKK